MPYQDLEKQRAANRANYRKNAPERIAQIRAWHKANPEARSRHHRECNWRRAGIKNTDGTPFKWADYQIRLANQNGTCAINGCQRQPSSFKKIFDVDHNHKTGIVRGLLCGDHNKALGKVNDSVDELQGLIDYLKIGERKCH